MASDEQRYSHGSGDRTKVAGEIKEFLMSRRARISPDEAGFPVRGTRRVAGLRREEVAQLAGVSVDYYTQIEQGKVCGASEEVLLGIADALRLSEFETTHLLNLGKAVRPTARTNTRVPRNRVPESVRAMIAALDSLPAMVQTTTLDIVETNALGRALFADVMTDGRRVPNLARFVFLDPRAVTVFPQWEAIADDVVGMLRVEATRSPESARVTTLIGELATRSPEFRVRWAAQGITAHRHGVKVFNHSAVGEISLSFEVLDVSSTPGLILVAYTAQVGTADHDKLAVLASWSATSQQPA